LFSSEADGTEAVNALTLNEIPFSATINSVADGLIMHPTTTFADEGTDITINLNISMIDVDGSETVSFTFTAAGDTLSEGLTFMVGGDLHADVTYSAGTYTVTNVPYEHLNDIVATSVEGLKGEFVIDVEAWTVDGTSNTFDSPETDSFDLSLYSHASGVTEYSVATRNMDATTHYITSSHYQIPLVISGLDLADKDGSENLSILISGLSASITLDVTTLPTGITSTQTGNDWLLALENEITNADYDAALMALENGDLNLISTTTDGVEEGVTVLAYSTLIATGETSSDRYDADNNIKTTTTGEAVTLNLTVDGTGSIEGSGADETLYGSDTADFLYGGLGDDILVGGAETDTLTGGGGADTFKITTDDFGSTETITDFENGIDVLDISEILEGTDLITDTDSLNEYLEFSQDGSHLNITIDSNGESTAVGDIYNIVLQNTLIADIDENDIID
jgi:Ca2+-binding RTX toxin-like protein